MTKTLRFILVGKTGSGKSETGDTILNKTGSFSITSPSCELVCAERSVYELCVLNTPDLFMESSEEIYLEMMKCMYMSAPGPHAILLVVPFGKLDDQYVERMENCIAITGDKVYDFLIIVFTRSDYDIGQKQKRITKNEIDDHVESLAEKVKEFVKRCHGVVGFDNSLNSENLEKMFEELISLVPDIISDNPQFYTNKAYEIAEIAVQFDVKETLEKMENDTKIENQQVDSTDAQEDNQGELKENKRGQFKNLMPRNPAQKSDAHQPIKNITRGKNRGERTLPNEQTQSVIRMQTQQNQTQNALVLATYLSLAMQFVTLFRSFR